MPLHGDDTIDQRLDRYTRFGIKLGLNNIRAVCAALGEPQTAAPAIHVAGTNGKGSTTAAICAMLRAANYPTGRYTSPHLTRVTERIAIDGVPVTEAALWRALDAVDQAAERAGCETVTYFEALTAAAFHIFKLRFTDAAVYEVGMGGRLDATNIIEPEITAISSVALDHTVHLGNTLPAVAAEKAGIIKPGIPVVCAAMPQEASEVIRRRAAELDAPLLMWSEDFGARGEPGALEGGWQRMTWWGTGHDDLEVRFPLRGRWQVQNVACALAVVHDLVRQGWNIKPPAMVAGLETLQWPGRMDWLSREPAVLFDCAHNPAAMDACVDTAVAECPQGVLPVLAVLRDKDVPGMCAAMARLGPRVMVTASDHPRALEADGLAEFAAEHFADVTVVPSLVDAVPKAILAAAGLPVFIAGSVMNYAQAARAVQALARPVHAP